MTLNSYKERKLGYLNGGLVATIFAVLRCEETPECFSASTKMHITEDFLFRCAALGIDSQQTLRGYCAARDAYAVSQDKHDCANASFALFAQNPHRDYRGGFALFIRSI